MAIEYKLILIDEFDWDYADNKKQHYKDIVKLCGFDIAGGADYLMIVRCYRTLPSAALNKLLQEGIVFDSAYYRQDNSTTLKKIYPQANR